MIAHDPLWVRMNREDGTYHCHVHGLLSDEDMRVTLARAGVPEENIERALNNPLFSWRSIRTFITVMEMLVQRVRKPQCRLIA